MRGIGAVIHFGPPTDSIAPSPDVSGRWSSIRDWFSLPAQDEAAQCFRVLYQPDETMSPSDRLKNFLKLKALASPGRQDNFTAERTLGTGETICMIASGKNSDFPPVTLHLSDQEWHTAQLQELAPAAESGESPRSKGIPITSTQIQAWLDLPQEAKRDAGGWRKWTRTQGITLGSAGLCLTNTGLTPYGRERLHPPKERGLPITVVQLRTWRDLSVEARSETGGWVKWALAQGIAITSAKKHLTNTGLTLYGMERLQRPEERGATITKAQILTWLNMPPEERNQAGGWITWAQAQGIATNSARLYLSNTGLTARGMARLQLSEERGSTITKAQFLKWADMSPEERSEAGGWRAWAQAQGISIRSAGNVLTNSGLTPFGTERLKSPEERGAPITNEQIRTWRDLPQEAKCQAGGWIKWAQAQEIAIGSASGYLTNTGLKANGMARLQQSPSATVTPPCPQASTSAGVSDEIPVSESPSPQDSEDISAPPAKQIKEEEDDVTWRTHQINNNLPILQHWRDPTISVMAQAEGRIETLQVTRWGPLFNALPRQTKARINQEIRWFLQNEGRHDARMNEMMSVAIPLDDRDGYRGRTIYARTDLAAFTVLGPYSGRLLDSETVRCEYEKEYGSEASNYYFATRSQERIVSGFPQGNILSLLNSPVFTQRTAEAEARQNVSAVLVGKNIHFFLTTRDVHAGEELWFDYGPDYQHFEPGEALRSAQVKEEPLSSEEE
ncbi:SET domain-containing protein-lysine N-methyltransferase [Salmonella enterica]|nr:SET domain-containing protein-lysine N-methyltransferase [Salmonella enterica]